MTRNERVFAVLVAILIIELFIIITYHPSACAWDKRDKKDCSPVLPIPTTTYLPSITPFVSPSDIPTDAPTLQPTLQPTIEILQVTPTPTPLVQIGVAPTAVPVPQAAPDTGRGK